MLDDGAIDIAFLFHHEDEAPPEISGHITVELGTDHLDLLVPERWNRAGQIQHLNDVADLPWIMGCVRCRSTAERLCRTRRIRTPNPSHHRQPRRHPIARLQRTRRRPAASQRPPLLTGRPASTRSPVDEAGARRVTAMIPDGLAAASEVEDLLDRTASGERESPATPGTARHRRRPLDSYSDS